MKSSGDSVVDMITRTDVFAGLERGDAVKLRRIVAIHRLSDGAVITAEGTPDPHVHVLWSGVAKVIKKVANDEFEVRRLGEGSTIGEMKLTDGEASSATVVAVGPVVVMSMSIDQLANEPALAHIHRQVLINVSKILASRLRHATATTVEAMARELTETKARLQAGLVVSFLLIILVTYSLIVAAIRELPARFVPSQAVLSSFVILGACIPMGIMIRMSPYPLASYGLTLRDWPRHVREAVLASIPVMLALLLLKVSLVVLVPGAQGIPVFDLESIGGKPFDPVVWWGATIAYCAISPFQEFFNRGGLQGALHKFLPPARGSINWKAVVLANLAFSVAHLHIGVKFALAALLLGFFWGWLYERQRSLIGVTISHMLVGSWAVSVLGFEVFLRSH